MAAVVMRTPTCASKPESKQKIIDKMVAAGLTPPVVREIDFKFDFPECQKVPLPVLPFANVSFAYSGKKEDFLYENLELGVDCDSRIALVGPNGAGKSTLLKLMTGELSPTIGTVDRHPALSIGKYHQHSVDVLDKAMTPLDFFMTQYPNTLKFKREMEEWRAYLGRYGVSGRMQTQKIGELSEGQQSRLVFAMICMQRPTCCCLMSRRTTWISRRSMHWLKPSSATMVDWCSYRTISVSSIKSRTRFGCAKIDPSETGTRIFAPTKNTCPRKPKKKRWSAKPRFRSWMHCNELTLNYMILRIRRLKRKRPL